MKISRESKILFVICFLDVSITIAVIAMGLAEEANPWMARLLDYGYVTFFMVKMATVVAAVIAAESYSKHNPVFVKRIMQIAIFAYLGLYVTLTAYVNFA